MRTTSRERVTKRRDALRGMGFRSVQIWVPDTRAPGFDAECQRQAARVIEADSKEAGNLEFLDAVLVDIFRDEERYAGILWAEEEFAGHGRPCNYGAP